MKREKLFEAIGAVKDKYLKRSEKRHVPLVNYSGWIACAACICIAVAAVLLMPEPTENVIVNEHNVINQTVLSPQLGLPSDEGATGDNVLSTIDSGTFFSINGMGFEAYSEQDVLVNLSFEPANAYTTPETLPIFKNKSYNPYWLSYGLNEYELHELVWDVLAGLGVDPFGKDLTKFEKVRASDSPRDPRGSLIPDDALLSIKLTAGFGTITVEANGFVEIMYTGGLELPEEYSIKNDPDEAMAYLTEQYSALLDFESATVVISEAARESGNISSAIVYDGAGDKTEVLLNRKYESAQFYFDDSGKLTMIRINNLLSVAECMGYYNTITADEAKALLLDGYYYSSYKGEPILDEEHIRGVELTYRTSDAEQVRIPFYRFYIELPPNEYSGEISYAAYYVPAIELEYIKTEYTPDFSFNN
ncbi:MAG: hypothetical protein E7628_00630 [Ruminococcaceae bacterium]|nr:hypothetical protein [Oscillospiraceae bacterium]